MNKKTLLPKKLVKLKFVVNPWNKNLWSASVDGRIVADIQFFPDGGTRPFHCYTTMPEVIDEGNYNTRAECESRCNWRASI